MSKAVKRLLCSMSLMLAAATPVAAFPIDSDNFYMRLAEVDVGPSDFRTTVIAYCDPGDAVVSGGCYNWDSFATLLQSWEWGFGRWRCDYNNTWPTCSYCTPVIQGRRGASQIEPQLRRALTMAGEAILLENRENVFLESRPFRTQERYEQKRRCE